MVYVCVCRRVSTHMCTRVCLGCQAALLDIGVDLCVSGLHMAEVLFKKGGFWGSILYEETQGKEDFFVSYFHSRSLCWLPFWQELALSDADVMKHSDGNEGWERGADSHINLICPWIAACVCPDLSTARRHQPPRSVQIPDTHTFSLSLPHTHIQLSIVKERPQFFSLNILFVSFLWLWDLIRIHMFRLCLFADCSAVTLVVLN